MGFIETVFLKVLSMSITASYVITVVCIVRVLLKKAPKAYAYALWSVVAFRLVCPVSFVSGFSLFNIAALFSAQKETGLPVPSFINANTAAPQMLASSTPLPSAGIQSGAPLTAPADGVGILIGIAAFVWCAGIFTMLTYSVVSYIKVRRAVRSAVRLQGNVYESESVVSPFVLGIIKPKIYIPFRMSETQKACILCHEQHHIRRLDHVVKPLAFLILSVYWFHPLVWLAYHCMIRDMEMSCDEKAVLQTGSKRDYSLSLLSAGMRQRLPVAGPLFFGESAVKARVKNVLALKKPKAWLIALALLLCLTAATACSADKPAEHSAAAEPAATPAPQTSADIPEPSQTVDTIDGLYVFEENIYTNPLSSFYADKGNMPCYSITDDKLLIIDQLNNTIEEFTGERASASVSKEDFDALFDDEIVLDGFLVPGISAYSQCRQYAVYQDEYKRVEYRVYLMDDEIWIANFKKDRIWSIYRLQITDAASVSIIGGADGPTSVYVNRKNATLDND